MTALAVAAVLCVLAWAALIVAAQLLNRDQSPLSMGMSGLARGRAPWVMKSSFIVRGLSALLLVAALPGWVPPSGSVLAGLVLFWVWGLGSAALAIADTDMPGELPTRAGAAHAIIALVAYVAAVAGALLISLGLLDAAPGASVNVLALPLAGTAACAMVIQFAAFWAAAREARDATAASAALAAAPYAAAPRPAPAPAAPAQPVVTPAPAVFAPAPPPLEAAGRPPLAAGASVPVAPVARDRSKPQAGDGRLFSLHDFAGFAGVFQRVFLGLLMAWTLVVAVAIALH